jgi:hypothetical protein
MNMDFTLFYYSSYGSIHATEQIVRFILIWIIFYNLLYGVKVGPTVSNSKIGIVAEFDFSGLGGSAGSNDDDKRSWWEKIKNYTYNHRKEILLGTAAVAAGLVIGYMAYHGYFNISSEPSDRSPDQAPTPIQPCEYLQSPQFHSLVVEVQQFFISYLDFKGLTFTYRLNGVLFGDDIFLNEFRDYMLSVNEPKHNEYYQNIIRSILEYKRTSRWADDTVQ